MSGVCSDVMCEWCMSVWSVMCEWCVCQCRFRCVSVCRFSVMF